MTWIRLEVPGAEILFSDRTGGVSAPPFDTAYAGYSRGDDPAHVDENRARIGAALGGRAADPNGWIALHQVHGAAVHPADRIPRGTPRGPVGGATAGSGAPIAPKADAAVSAEP
ncbi:MAG TPA: laccase domain-containing protein, partial [Acidimicrobiia bacterium]|nr:laccase domain-containing protein [Acidimicrobiia bacterium]